jgi:hypothetical protein
MIFSYYHCENWSAILYQRLKGIPRRQVHLWRCTWPREPVHSNQNNHYDYHIAIEQVLTVNLSASESASILNLEIGEFSKSILRV